MQMTDIGDSAVDYLVKRFSFINWLKDRDEISYYKYTEMYINAVKKAKDMERDQISESIRKSYTENKN
jgi:hypothetical protein